LYLAAVGELREPVKRLGAAQPAVVRGRGEGHRLAGADRRRLADCRPGGTWEKQVRSARGFKRVRKHSKYFIYTAIYGIEAHRKRPRRFK
jgi:hypothetical protein